MSYACPAFNAIQPARTTKQAIGVKTAATDARGQPAIFNAQPKGSMTTSAPSARSQAGSSNTSMLFGLLGSGIPTRKRVRANCAPGSASARDEMLPIRRATRIQAWCQYEEARAMMERASKLRRCRFSFWLARGGADQNRVSSELVVLASWLLRQGNMRHRHAPGSRALSRRAAAGTRSAASFHCASERRG
jgi:hypothetical protein